MSESELTTEIELSQPQEWQTIIAYLDQYPTFYFRSGTLSGRLYRIGLSISAQKLSKVLLRMHDAGILDRRTSGNGVSTRAYYKIKK